MSTDATIGRFSIGKAVVLGAAGLLVALSGQAAERAMLGNGVASVTVSYADLDLASAAGAQTLYARLSSAARQVCGAEPRNVELRQHASFRSCYHQALDEAVDRVDSEQLYALHQSRSAASRMG